MPKATIGTSTAQAVPGKQGKRKCLAIKAASGNAGTIYIAPGLADATASDFPLAAGEGLVLQPDKGNDYLSQPIQAIASQAGQELHYIEWT